MLEPLTLKGRESPRRSSGQRPRPRPYVTLQAANHRHNVSAPVPAPVPVIVWFRAWVLSHRSEHDLLASEERAIAGYPPRPVGSAEPARRLKR